MKDLVETNKVFNSKTVFSYMAAAFFVMIVMTGCAANKTSLYSSEEQGLGKMVDLFVVNKKGELSIIFVSDKKIEFNSFMVAEPLRLIVDIAGVDARGIKNKISVHAGGVLEIIKKTSNSKGFSRFEIHLMQPSPYDVEKKNNVLSVKFVKPAFENIAYNFDMNRRGQKKSNGNQEQAAENNDEYISGDVMSMMLPEGDSANKEAEAEKQETEGESNIDSASMPLISTRNKANLEQIRTTSQTPMFTSLNMPEKEEVKKPLNLSTAQGETSGSKQGDGLTLTKSTAILEESISADDDRNSSAGNTSTSSAKKQKDLSGVETFAPITVTAAETGLLAAESPKVAKSALQSFTSRWGTKRKILIKRKKEKTSQDNIFAGSGPGSAAEAVQSQDSTASSMPAQPGEFVTAFNTTTAREWANISSAVQDREVQDVDIPGNYTIGSADVLEVLVWKNEALSKVVIVRPDGKITLPLIGDFIAAGKTPMQLRANIIERLKQYKEVPEVSVIVKEINSYVVYLLGEINKPGSYNLRRNTSLLQAITLAGGFTQFASKNSIIVLRNEQDKEVRFNIKYKDIVSGEGENIKLRAGDTIIVP